MHGIHGSSIKGRTDITQGKLDVLAAVVVKTYIQERIRKHCQHIALRIQTDDKLSKKRPMYEIKTGLRH